VALAEAKGLCPAMLAVLVVLHRPGNEMLFVEVDLDEAVIEREVHPR
jgi:hypothetical protein